MHDRQERRPSQAALPLAGLCLLILGLHVECATDTFDAGAVTLMTARVASVIAEDAGVTLENQPRLAAPEQQPAPHIGPGTVLLLVFIFFFSGLLDFGV